MNLFEQGFRATMQFIAMKSEDIVELRLEATNGLLLDGFDARGKLFQALGGLIGAGNRLFNVLGVRFEGFAYGGTLRGGFFAQFRAQFVGLLFELARRALFDSMKRAFQSTLQTALRCFYLARELFTQGILRFRLCSRDPAINIFGGC